MAARRTEQAREARKAAEAQVTAVNLGRRSRLRYERLTAKLAAAREAERTWVQWINAQSMASAGAGYGVVFLTLTHSPTTRKGTIVHVRDPVWVSEQHRRFHRKLGRIVYGRRKWCPLGGVYAIEPHRSGDLHGHAVVWGLPDVERYSTWFEPVDDAWGLGRTQVKMCTEDEVRYCAKYAAKGYLGDPMCGLIVVGRAGDERDPQSHFELN